MIEVTNKGLNLNLHDIWHMLIRDLMRKKVVSSQGKWTNRRGKEWIYPYVELNVEVEG